MVGATAAAALAFPAVCRRAVKRAADAYGAEVTVGEIAPRLVGARLRDIDVSFADLPAIRVHLDEIDVAYTGGTRRVAIHGGQIRALGVVSDIVEQVRTWRSHRSHTSSASGEHRELEVSGLRVAWNRSASAGEEAAVAEGVAVQRTADGVTFTASEVRLSRGPTWVSARDAHVDLVASSGNYRVGSLTASTVTAEIDVPREKEAAVAASPAPVLPEPIVEPIAPRSSRGRARTASDPREARDARETGALGRRTERGGSHRKPAVEPPKAAPDVPPEPVATSTSKVRALLIGMADEVDRNLEPGARVKLDGLQARVKRGPEVLNLGPGSLRLERADGRLIVELAPAPPTAPPSAADEALTFRVSVPLTEGAGDISAEIQGGPIWLSALGIHEGDFGLFDVSRSSLTTKSHLVLPPDGKTLRIDGSAKVRSLSLRSAALSDEPVAGLEVAVRVRGEVALDGSRAQLAEAEADVGAVRLELKGDYERISDEARRFRGTFEVPLMACQSMFEAVPSGLVPKLQGLRFAGSYALKGRVDGDTSDLDRKFALDWDASNTCRVVEAPPAISVERFKSPFKRTAYDGEGRPVMLETGPGTPDWTPGSAISKFMEAAVLTTEDGAFLRHQGFDHQAIRNSIRENLRRHRFVRGASTISMQLAKNLYLDRGKNLSRKLQEAILTMYLEQELTKEQILELYFNVVEFGPMVYGVGPAARTYFNTSPRELALSQALYLSSIMPNPKLQHFGAGGAVATSWMSYLHRLMKISRTRNLITDEELEEGLRETAVRGSPAPTKSGKGSSTGDDGAEPPVESLDIWQP